MEQVYFDNLLRLYARPGSDERKTAVRTMNTTIQEISKDIWSIPQTPNTLLLMGVPGSGKTRTAAHLVMSAIRNLYGIRVSEQNGHILFISYNASVFTDELMRNPEHGFVSEFSQSKRGNINMKSSDQINEAISKIVYSMGYKMFAMTVFPNSMDANEKQLLIGSSAWTDEHTKFMYEGKITINVDFIESIMRDYIIVMDEMHEMHSGGHLNNHGMAASMIARLYPSVRILYISATPITTKPEEIVCLYNLVMREQKTLSDFYGFADGIGRLHDHAIETVKSIGKRTIMLNSPPSDAYPDIVFEGQSIQSLKREGIKMNYVPCHMTDQQISCYAKLDGIKNRQKVCETCAVPIEDGDILANVGKNYNVLLQYLPDLESCFRASSKLKMLHKFLIDDGMLFSAGNIVIYTILQIFPETLLLEHFLLLCGLQEYTLGSSEENFHLKGYENYLKESRLCMICGPKHIHGTHKQIIPVFATVHSGIVQQHTNSIIDVFNSPHNEKGHRIRVLCGTNTITVSISLYNANKMFLFRTPYSFSHLRQLIGRIFRSGIIYSSEIPQVIHIIPLLIVNPGPKLSIEETREINKYDKWIGIRSIISLICSNSIVASHIDLNIQESKYQNGPRLIDSNKGSRNLAELSSEIHSFLLYPRTLSLSEKKEYSGQIPNFLVLQDRRVTIACVIIKLLLISVPRLGESMLQELINRDVVMMSYNLGGLLLEDFFIAAAMMEKFGKSMNSESLQMVIMNTVGKGDIEELISRIILSPRIPWIIDSHWVIRNICIKDRWIFSSSDGICNIDPNIIDYMDTFSFICERPVFIRKDDIEITPTIERLCKLCEQPHVARCQLLIFLNSLKSSDLCNFLQVLLLDKVEYIPDELNGFLDLLENLKILIRAPSTKTKKRHEYKAAYINGKYRSCSNMQLVDANSSLTYYQPHDPKNDVRLRISVNKNVYQLIFQTAPFAPIVDMRRYKKGVNIKNLTMQIIMHMLSNCEGILAAHLKDNIYEVQQQKSVVITEWLCKHIYKFHLAYPETGYIAFI